MAFNRHAFDQFLSEHKLVGARCDACAHIAVPPRPLCPACRGTQMQWVPLSGEGKLRTYTAIAVVPPAMAALGYGRSNPFVSGVVELAEGPMVAARIIDVDAAAPEQLVVGTPMQVRFVSEGQGTLLAFGPAASPAETAP